MPTTVLVTGSSGLLGTWLRRTAPPDVAVVPLVHRNRTGDPGELVADLRDAGAAEQAFAAARPELVIHAAYAKDDASIVAATTNVVEGCRDAGADLVHISTDSVFRGDGAPQPEAAAPDPVSDYGRWKAEAERIAGEADRAAVVRLPLVVSVEPPDHIVTAIVDGAAAGRPTTWFTDEIRQPAMADELAACIWRIASLERSDRAGTWHLAGPERLSRWEMAERMIGRLGLPPAAIAAAPAPPSDVRPRDLHLLDDRARTVVGWSPRRILT